MFLPFQFIKLQKETCQSPSRIVSNLREMMDDFSFAHVARFLVKDKGSVQVGDRRLISGRFPERKKHDYVDPSLTRETRRVANASRGMRSTTNTAPGGTSHRCISVGITR